MNTLIESAMFPLSNKSKSTEKRMDHYLHVTTPGKTRRVILYSHGNGVTLNQIKDSLTALAHECAMNVFAYEYPGYGECVGYASAINVKAAAEKAYRVLIESYSYMPENIVLMGRSIGTGPTLHLFRIQNCKPSALVLISPFTSISALVQRYPLCGMQHFANYFFSEPFDNTSSIAIGPDTPTLFIHGQYDEIIPMEMSLELFENSLAQCKQICIKADGTHNAGVWDVKEVAIFLAYN